MKKISNDQRQYVLRLQYQEVWKAKKRVNIKKQRRDKKNRKKKYKSQINTSIKKVAAPEEFSLFGIEAREKLLNFLKKIETQLHSGNKVHILFNNTRKLQPCGTLWTTAKLELLLDSFPNKITCSYPIDEIVEQLFQHIGLLKKLGKIDQRKEINADNVRHWHYVSGSSTDDVSKFKTLLNSIKVSEDTKSGLFDSMSEAVTNAIHHAYPENHSRDWRMFAQHKDDMLTVAICDFGIGIPNSIREKPEVMDWIRSPVHRLKKKYDTSLIEIAVESARSQTRLPHRGKGLPDMLEFVKSGKAGGLRIDSARGCFIYNASSKSELSQDYSSAINGTIIQWQVSLEPENEH